jgi:hypothetical protein
MLRIPAKVSKSPMPRCTGRRAAIGVLNCAAMDTLDIAVRLCAAALVGVLLGLNRDLHGKQTGVRPRYCKRGNLHASVLTKKHACTRREIEERLAAQMLRPRVSAAG